MKIKDYLCFGLLAMLFSSFDYVEEGKKWAAEQLNSDQQNQEKDLLKKRIAEVKGFKTFNEESKSEKENINRCLLASHLSADPQSSLYVFMSFSLPDEAWINLSKEVEKLGGVFVLRGLPQNSFKEMAVRMQDLRKKNINAPIQIDPRLFERYRIDAVPSFVLCEGEQFDKLSGNVSLSFALEKMTEQSATGIANTLRAQL